MVVVAAVLSDMADAIVITLMMYIYGVFGCVADNIMDLCCWFR